MVLRYYPAIIARDDGTDYGVVFPDLPGCVSTGETVQEAARCAAEALAGHIGSMVEHGDPVPDPSAPDAPLPDWLVDEDEAEAGEVVRVLVPVEMPGKTVRVNVTMDEGLLRRLDAAAAAEGNTRSGFLAQVVRERLVRSA